DPTKATNRATNGQKLVFPCRFVWLSCMPRIITGARAVADIIRLEHVYKEYRLGTHKVQALTDVSFSVETGMLLALGGPSGSGKSTILNLIGLIDVPSKGRVVVAGEDVSGQTPD